MQVEKRDSMVFYDSFYESVIDLPAEEFKKSVCTILNYGLRGIAPETSGIEKTIFVLVKPQIDRNNQRWNCAKKSHVGDGKKSDEPTKKKGKSSASKNACDEQNVASDINFDEECSAEFEAELDEYGAERGLETSVAEDEEIKHSDKKQAFGRFRNVYLTESENKDIITSIGEEEYNKRLDFFSSYLMRKPDHKSACHYVDMTDWVANAIIDRAPRNVPEKVPEKSGGKKSSIADYSFEDFYEIP